MLLDISPLSPRSRRALACWLRSRDRHGLARIVLAGSPEIQVFGPDAQEVAARVARAVRATIAARARAVVVVPPVRRPEPLPRISPDVGAMLAPIAVGTSALAIGAALAVAPAAAPVAALGILGSAIVGGALAILAIAQGSPALRAA